MIRQGKTIYVAVLMVAGVLVNLAGKWLATVLTLPLWMDAIGTGFTSCILGPIYGAVCGVMNNVLYGFTSPTSFAYGLTSAAIGIVMGICMRKGMFEHIFTAMSTSVIVAFVSTIISTPLNLFFWNGTTGNVWGDALYGMLTSRGLNSVIASALGELFVDFPDKVVMVLITYGILRISKLRELEEKVGLKRMITFSLLIALLTPLLLTQTVETVDATQVDTMEQVSGYADIQYTQTVYNSDNGLTSGEANAIIETPDGYIWIGTYAGLYRYDGHNFTMMDFESVKNVNRLYVDKLGRLWIGTNDKGVSVYQDGRIIETMDKNSGLPSNSIRCIGEDDQGNYYVGTSASLCRLSENNGLQVEKVYDSVTYANNISTNDAGQVALVTNAGELVFVENEKITGKYVLDEEGMYYTCCVFDEKGYLRVATSSNEVYTWNFTQNMPNRTNTILTGDLSYIHSLYEDGDGMIWVCSDNGIGYLDEKRFYPVSTGEFNSSIDTMIRDYQGNLWLTSSRLGVLKLAENSFCDIYGQCGLEDNVVNSVTMWEGKLYAGTDNGLIIIDPSTNKNIEDELTELLQENRIRCMKVDSNNHLWVSTSAGVGLLEVTPDGEITSYGTEQGTVGDRFRSTIELSDGTIVAAENTGMDFIADGNVVATLGVENGLTNPQILSMIEMDDDTLYAGSDGDGIMVIRDYKVVDTITEQDGLPSGVILRMVKVEDGLVIVTSNCLCYMDARGKITELKEFPYANNYDVVMAEDGNLWVLGSAGIYIVDQKKLVMGKELTAELLDSRKGLKTSLTANSWNYLDGSMLYLSCSSGVYSIDMNNYSVYTGSYRMMVDYLDANNVSYAMTEGEVTKIPTDITRIRIRPELLNYTLNDPYVSYYLEGFDEEETVVQQSELTDVSYTNLPAGTYVFHVSVLDNTGSNVIENYVYTLEKLPQFWEHGWFMVYLVLVCVLGIAYVTWLVAVLHSNKIIEKQKQEIELARKQAEMGNETILAIAKTVDAKDGRTSQHSARVSEYSVQLAKHLGWSEEECENIRQIALLHDIGKIGIPDAILNKPDRLTDDEYKIMKSHVTIGAKILKDFTLIDNATDGVRYHHERFDGRGYPYGLQGEKIPVDARIIGIADAFDAMTCNRVYRNHLDMDKVISELTAGKGTQFDPTLVDIFLGLIEDGSIHVGDGADN